MHTDIAGLGGQAPDGQKEVFLRHDVTLDTSNCAYFAATDLTDQQMAETIQKRAVLGAAFNTRIDALPNTYARVIWEAEEVVTPPAHLRPTKPKLWLLRSVQLEEGFMYALH